MSDTAVSQSPFGEVDWEESLQNYEEKGYLAFEELLSADEVGRVVGEFRSFLSRLAELNEGESEYVAGNGDGVHGGALLKSLRSRGFVQFEKGVEPDLSDLDQMERSVRKFMSYEDESDFFRYLLNDHPALKAAASRILGEPAVLYQSLALVKPAKIGAVKAWHQDNAYFSIQDPSKIVGIWIALEDAVPENGCMFVIEGGHRLGPMKHVITNDCEIERGKFDKSLAKAVPVKAGGGLFFKGDLPHFTPPNRSNRSRRAIQFHFRGESNALVSKSEYEKIYVDKEGLPASCHVATPEKF